MQITGARKNNPFGEGKVSKKPTYKNPFKSMKKDFENTNRNSIETIGSNDREQYHVRRVETHRPPAPAPRPQPQPQLHSQPQPHSQPHVNNYSVNNSNGMQSQNTSSNLSQNLFGGNPMAQVGLQLGQNYLKNTVDNLESNSDTYVQRFFSSSLQNYFDIDNDFLLRKIRYLLFPFRLKKGEVQQMEIGGFVDGTQTGQQEDYYHSVLRLDLYIPLMSLATYILLSCLAMGLTNKFVPEMIFRNATNCFLLSLFETLVIKAGMLINNNKNVGFMDILSLSGYKYLGMCLIAVLRMIPAGQLIFVLKYIAELYFCATSFSNIYNSLVDLNSHAHQTQDYQPLTGQTENKKLVIGLGVLQLLFTWMLLYISF